MNFGKIMIRVLTKVLKIDSPSTSGEFIRYLQKATNSAPECSVEKKWQKPNQKDDK